MPIRKNHKPSLVHLFAALLLLFLAGCTGGPVDTSRSFRTVVVDPGHGGMDSGVSHYGLREKDLNLDVALRLRPKLQGAGFKVVMTRTTDVFIPLNTRPAISNAHSQVFFISIHFNDSPAHYIHGATVYYYSPMSAPMAQTIVNSLGALTYNRGIMFCHFRVLRRNRYPAVLVECGFISNRAEAARCATPAYREAIATRIAQAIIRGRYSVPDQPVTPASY